jgi:hypothetical protein
MEAIRSSETAVHTRSTRRHIPEDDILHSHRRENLKSYKLMLIFTANVTEITDSFNCQNLLPIGDGDDDHVLVGL